MCHTVWPRAYRCACICGVVSNMLLNCFKINVDGVTIPLAFEDPTITESVIVSPVPRIYLLHSSGASCIRLRRQKIRSRSLRSCPHDAGWNEDDLCAMFLEATLHSSLRLPGSFVSCCIFSADFASPLPHFDLLRIYRAACRPAS